MSKASGAVRREARSPNRYIFNVTSIRSLGGVRLMEWLPLALAGFGVIGVVLALISAPMERKLPITEPLVALLAGMLVGPAVLNLIEVTAAVRDELLLEGTRVLLALSVMAAALRFPATSLRGLVKAVVILLAVVMPIAAVVSGGFALALGAPLSLALLIGACLAPTDPVLAASVVSGEPATKSLSQRLRGILTMESGANDGLGIVLVGLAIAAVVPGRSWPDAMLSVGWEVIVAIIGGAGLGWLAGRALTLALRHHELGNGPELVFTMLLAVGVLGLARLVDAGGVLAVFTAGLVYNAMIPGTPRKHQVAVDEGVNKYAVMPLFALLGIVAPWSAWRDLGWGAVLFVVGVILARRLLFVLVLARPLGLSRGQAAFMGWFGPMGVSALFYMAHARSEGVTDPVLFSAVTLAVTASVVVFGVTAVPGRRVYARHLPPRD